LSLKKLVEAVGGRKTRAMKSTPRIVGLLIAAAGIAACANPFRGVRHTEHPPSPAEVAELWSDPGDTRQDLFYGAGGAELVPSPDVRYEFVDRDETGFSRGYDVRDPQGRLWSVKLGVEARPEVAVSRILWAVGYHQHPTHYVRRWTLVGGGTPGPQLAGRFRLKPEGHRKAGEWSFFDNPFVDTAPYRGLLSILLIMNSYDLADSNNALYDVSPAADGVSRWYVVKDTGGALGGPKSPLGFVRSGTKDDIDGFETTGFVKGFDGGRAELTYKGRYYRNLYDRHEVADIRWVCDRLGRITDAMWQDAFRAAGYSPEMTTRYVRKIHEKLDTAQQGALRASAAP
jgi:hypothetical protein